MAVHPTAIVYDGAEVDSSAEIGPYCVVGPKVKIGAETRLVSHVVVDNHTTLGARNVIYPFASVPTPVDIAATPAGELFLISRRAQKVYRIRPTTPVE